MNFLNFQTKTAKNAYLYVIKKIYQIYCKQVNKVKNLEILIDKYENANNLDLGYCRNIKDFIPIYKLERLEYLDVSNTNISEILFLEKTKSLKN